MFTRPVTGVSVHTGNVRSRWLEFNMPPVRVLYCTNYDALLPSVLSVWFPVQPAVPVVSKIICMYVYFIVLLMIILTLYLDWILLKCPWSKLPRSLLTTCLCWMSSSKHSGPPTSSIVHCRRNFLFYKPVWRFIMSMLVSADFPGFLNPYFGNRCTNRVTSSFPPLELWPVKRILRSLIISESVGNASLFVICQK